MNPSFRVSETGCRKADHFEGGVCDADNVVVENSFFYHCEKTEETVLCYDMNYAFVQQQQEVRSKGTCFELYFLITPAVNITMYHLLMYTH